MLAVINGSKYADGIERSDTLEEITNNYKHLTNSDSDQDMVVAKVNGVLIAYNRVSWRQQEDGKRVYTIFGYLLHEWRRRGIGTAMLRHGENRVREITMNKRTMERNRLNRLPPAQKSAQLHFWKWKAINRSDGVLKCSVI
jgi:ribosomal protein S18 acetylase RimI-like enzyme